MSGRVALPPNLASAAAPQIVRPQPGEKATNVCIQLMMSFLERRDQAAAAQVCRHWRYCLGTDQNLDLCLAACLKRVGQVVPILDKSVIGRKVGYNNQIALFYQPPFLRVLDRKSGVVSDEIKLSDFMTASPIGATKFITFSRNGDVAIWEMQKKNIEGIVQQNIFEALPHLAETKHLLTWADIKPPSDQSDAGLILYRKNLDPIKLQVFIGHAITFKETPAIETNAFNSTQNFYVDLLNKYIGCRQILSPSSDPDRWNFNIPYPAIGDYVSIEANDQTVLLTQCKYRSPHLPTFFYVLNAQDGKELFRIQQHCALPLRQSLPFCDTKFSWLYRNYFVIWACENLQIWDIRTGNCLSQIKLCPQLLTQEELKSASFFYDPISGVEFTQSELVIFYSKRHFDYQIAIFSLKKLFEPIQPRVEQEDLPFAIPAAPPLPQPVARPPALPPPRPVPPPAAPPSSLLSRLAQAVSKVVLAIWEAIQAFFLKVFRLR